MPVPLNQKRPAVDIINNLVDADNGPPMKKVGRGRPKKAAAPISPMKQATPPAGGASSAASTAGSSGSKDDDVIIDDGPPSKRTKRESILPSDGKGKSAAGKAAKAQAKVGKVAKVAKAKSSSEKEKEEKEANEARIVRYADDIGGIDAKEAESDSEDEKDEADYANIHNVAVSRVDNSRPAKNDPIEEDMEKLLQSFIKKRDDWRQKNNITDASTQFHRRQMPLNKTDVKEILRGFWDASKRQDHKTCTAFMSFLNEEQKNALVTDHLSKTTFPLNASRCLAFNPDPEDVSKYEALQRGDEGFVQDNKYLTLGMINDRPFGKCGRDSAVNPGITITLNSYLHLHLKEIEEEAAELKSKGLPPRPEHAPFLPKPKNEGHEGHEDCKDWDFFWTSITVNKDSTCAAHVDSGNLGPSYIVSFGNHVGGDVWISHDGSQEIIPVRNDRAITSCKRLGREVCLMKADKSTGKKVEDRRFVFQEDAMGAGGGKYSADKGIDLAIPVKRYDIHQKLTKFDGRIPHATSPFFETHLKDQKEMDKHVKKSTIDGVRDLVGIDLLGQNIDKTTCTAIDKKKSCGIPYNNYDASFRVERKEQTHRFVVVYYPHRVFYRPAADTIDKLKTFGFTRIGSEYAIHHERAKLEFTQRRALYKGVKMYLKTSKLKHEQVAAKAQVMNEIEFRYRDIITLRDVMEDQGLREYARIVQASALEEGIPKLWTDRKTAGLVKLPQELFEDFERTFHHWCRVYERRILPEFHLRDPQRKLYFADNKVQFDTKSGEPVLLKPSIRTDLRGNAIKFDKNGVIITDDEPKSSNISRDNGKSNGGMKGSLVEERFMSNEEWDYMINRNMELAPKTATECQIADTSEWFLALDDGLYLDLERFFKKKTPKTKKEESKNDGAKGDGAIIKDKGKSEKNADKRQDKSLLAWLSPVHSDEEKSNSKESNKGLDIAGVANKKRSKSVPPSGNVSDDDAKNGDKKKKAVGLLATMKRSTTIPKVVDVETCSLGGPSLTVLRKYKKKSGICERPHKEILQFGWCPVYSLSRCERRCWRYYRSDWEQGKLMTLECMIRDRYFSSLKVLPPLEGADRCVNERILPDGMRVCEDGIHTTQFNQAWWKNFEDTTGNECEDKEEGAAKKARADRVDNRNQKRGAAADGRDYQLEMKKSQGQKCAAGRPYADLVQDDIAFDIVRRASQGEFLLPPGYRYNASLDAAEKRKMKNGANSKAVNPTDTKRLLMRQEFLRNQQLQGKNIDSDPKKVNKKDVEKGEKEEEDDLLADDESSEKMGLLQKLFDGDFKNSKKGTSLAVTSKTTMKVSMKASMKATQDGDDEDGGEDDDDKDGDEDANASAGSTKKMGETDKQAFFDRMTNEWKMPRKQGESECAWVERVFTATKRKTCDWSNPARVKENKERSRHYAKLLRDMDPMLPENHHLWKKCGGYNEIHPAYTHWERSLSDCDHFLLDYQELMSSVFVCPEGAIFGTELCSKEAAKRMKELTKEDLAKIKEEGKTKNEHVYLGLSHWELQQHRHNIFKFGAKSYWEEQSICRKLREDDKNDKINGCDPRWHLDYLPKRGKVHGEKRNRRLALWRKEYNEEKKWYAEYEKLLEKKRFAKILPPISPPMSSSKDGFAIPYQKEPVPTTCVYSFYEKIIAPHRKEDEKAKIKAEAEGKIVKKVNGCYHAVDSAEDKIGTPLVPMTELDTSLVLDNGRLLNKLDDKLHSDPDLNALLKKKPIRTRMADILMSKEMGYWDQEEDTYFNEAVTDEERANRPETAHRNNLKIWVEIEKVLTEQEKRKNKEAKAEKKEAKSMKSVPNK